jgi:hypothetical protein
MVWRSKQLATLPTLDPVVILGKSINIINIQMHAPTGLTRLVQSVQEFAQSNLGLRLFQGAAAGEAVQAGMEIDQEPRPEATEVATPDGSAEVGRLM